MIETISHSAWLHSLSTTSWRIAGKVNCIQELLWPPIVQPDDVIPWPPLGDLPIKTECVADGKPVRLPPILPPSLGFMSVKFRDDLLLRLEVGVLSEPLLLNFTIHVYPDHWLRDMGLLPAAGGESLAEP